MSLDTATVCAVTVTYGSRFELCRAAVVQALESGVAHMIVVDNGSSDGPRLAAEFEADSRVSVVRTGENLGSAGGFSAGVEASIRRHEEYVLLLDDDNLLGPDSLTMAVRFHRELVATLKDDRLIVACMRASYLLHQKVAQGHPVHRVYPPAGSFISLDIFQRISRTLPGKGKGLDAQESALPVLPVAPYGGLLARRIDLESLGGPDPRLTLYEDDIAWTNGFSQQGYRIVLCIDAPIEDADTKWHEGGVDARGPLKMLRANDTARLYYSVRNRVLFDFGRSRAPVQRVRYLLNRALFFAFVMYAGRGAALAGSRKTFFAAVNHGEAGLLDLGPPL